VDTAHLQTFSADAVRLAELLLACQVETKRDDDVGPDAVVKGDSNASVSC
jgi:hypothetical protein